MILERLKSKCSDAKDKDCLKSDKYKFWLVASDMDLSDDERYLDNLGDTFNLEDTKSSLKGVLSKELLHTVEVFPSDLLKDKLQS